LETWAPDPTFGVLESRKYRVSIEKRYRAMRVLVSFRQGSYRYY